MADSVLEQVRELGVAMGSCYAPTVRVVAGERIAVRSWVGWTTDERAADSARELGATVRPCPSSDPRYSGHEVVVHEVVT